MRHRHGVRGGNANATTSIRDAYGFEVKKEMLSLYQKYAPLWEKEELERSERWDAFLAHFETIYEKVMPEQQSQGSALEQLEQACRSWAPDDRGASKDLNDWQHQLRSLVQAGIPMTLRGKMWRTFLGLEAVKQEGYYEQLVYQALGNKYSKRKEKVAAEDQADSSPASQQQDVSFDETGSSPGHASHLAQPSKSMALSDAAEMTAELHSLAAASPEAASQALPDMPSTPQASSNHNRGTGSGQLGSTMLSTSNDSLSALPTPTHPSAAAAAAQELNNALGRSLLKAPHLTEEVAAASSPHSQRLTSACSVGASSELSSKVGAGWHPSSRDWNLQIEKDLHRTFPGHPVMDGTGRSALRRILAAYARRNPSVGYCQGMNFIAGCLLLFMDEEDTFWCLAIIVEELLPGYYSMAMVEPQVDQLVFKELVDMRFPRLSGHLEGHGVNVSSVSTNWFLCIFVNSLPLESCLRVWDIFFLECCSSVLFRVALALVDIYSQALVATTDSVDAFSLLQNMAPMSYDSSRLIDVACISFSSTDHAHLASLQARHRQTVLAQFASHGREVDEEGWNSSGNDSEGVQRSAHSTPQAGQLSKPRKPLGEAAQTDTNIAEGQEELQVTSRSRSAFIPRRLKQVKVAAQPLAGSPGGSPQGALEGDSPSSQGQSSAAGSPWSPVSSLDWHTTPRWPQFANFGAHSSRPANPSTLSHLTSAVPCYAADTGTPDSQDDRAGQAGMGEEEYQAAVAQTAELAAQLPKIGVLGRRPPQGPSMPQRLINHFRSAEAVLGEQLRSALPRSSSGFEDDPNPKDLPTDTDSAEQPLVSGRMLPPAGTPTPSPSPAYHAAALHPAPWGVQRTSWDAFQPESPAQPPAPPSTPQVAGSFHPGSCQCETPGPDSPHATPRMDWPAGPAEESQEAAAPESFTSHHSSPNADSSQLNTTFPPNLPGLLTTHARSGSEELNLHEAESSRASSRIPAHSALSRMLQENSAQEHGLEEGAAWSLGAGGESSPDSAAVRQLLHVVEGLEEELFSSEARRNDAEVQAEVLETSMQDLQTRLAQAQQELVLKRQTVEGLTHKFDRAAVVLGNADAQLADKQVSLAAAKAQLAAHDKHLSNQDVIIKGLLRKQGQQEGLGASFLKSLHTHFRFPGKPEKGASANLDDTGAGTLQDEA
ncbi:hypothetical protein WJX77_007676 [Trebouxia sp. C0004]